MVSKTGFSTKKDLVFNAFNNRATERVPVGFWFHYTKNEILSAYENPEMRMTTSRVTKTLLNLLNLIL